MSLLAVIPVGRIEEPVLNAVGQVVREAIGWETAVRHPVPMPPEAFDEVRRQHEALHVLRAVLTAAPADAERILGIVNEDLFIPMLTFVFGQAQLNGRGAVMSTARLRQEYYGLPANDRLFLQRVRTEALHEIGHTFGLIHCSEPGCAMRLSNTIQQVDAKPPRLCGGCDLLIHEHRREVPSAASKGNV